MANISKSNNSHNYIKKNFLIKTTYHSFESKVRVKSRESKNYQVFLYLHIFSYSIEISLESGGKNRVGWVTVTRLILSFA